MVNIRDTFKKHFTKLFFDDIGRRQNFLYLRLYDTIKGLF